jgi:hypothetical protein
LHSGLLGFEPEAGVALADGTDAEVGDKLVHKSKSTGVLGFVTRDKRTLLICKMKYFYPAAPRQSFLYHGPIAYLHSLL